MIKYGLISQVDARTIEKTLDLIQDEKINVLEIGLYGGDSGKGIKEYCASIGKECFITGIDNNSVGEKLRFEYDRLIIGNSAEVAYLIKPLSQDFIFIDGCHAFPSVVADFFCYAQILKDGGYMAFHDTGWHIKPMTGYQDMGSKEDPSMYISVRAALIAIGLFKEGYIWSNKWELVFDEADKNDPMGGVTVFRKL